MKLHLQLQDVKSRLTTGILLTCFTIILASIFFNETAAQNNSVSSRTNNTLPQNGRPNIVFILMDNFGYGEVGAYGGGILRGAATPRIDKLAEEGYKLLNFNTEAICSPSRAALMTGRFAVRSGVITTSPHKPYGLVQWERTIAEVLSDNGYATALYGKWHLGNTDGRFPVDQGFDEYYGIPNTTSIAAPGGQKRSENGEDGYFSVILEGKKGEKVKRVKEYDLESRREIDNEVTERAVRFIERNAGAKKPFYLYVPFTQTHVPVVPSKKFDGSTGEGYWADVLAQADSYVGRILDALDNQKLRDNTILVFTSDNGAEFAHPFSGWAGPWSGSYNTAMEGGLRTPFIIRWPGKVPAKKVSNEIVHIADLFPTLAKLTGSPIPVDRPIDGVDQSKFLLGQQENSNRIGFPVFYHSKLLAVKYKNYKVHYFWKEVRSDSLVKLDTPRIINLLTNPTERLKESAGTNNFNSISRYGSEVEKYYEDIKKKEENVNNQANEIISAIQQSFTEYPNIPEFSPDPYIPPYQGKDEKK